MFKVLSSASLGTVSCLVQCRVYSYRDDSGQPPITLAAAMKMAREILVFDPMFL